MNMSRRICVFGASTTWGAWDTERGGWVNRLRLFIENEMDRKFQVYNMGVSGDTTDDLVKRFELEAKVRKPEIIIFVIGSNDSTYRPSLGGNNIPLDKYINNLNRLYEEAW